MKYAIAAPVIAGVMRRTSWLDGSDDEPPRAINFAGGGSFTAIGQQQVKLITSRAGLTAKDRVLDIGCGMGRIALPLSREFPKIDYFGFDIVAYGVTWISKKMQDRVNFQFCHVDVANSFYNPRGRLSPDNYRFPLEDGSRDIAYATSVFTHLLEPSTRNYLKETARVLAPNGRAYLTTFIDDGSPRRESAFTFQHQIGCAKVESIDEPELAVAFSLLDWGRMAHDHGLKLTKVFRGSWRGDGAGEDFQDALLFEKVDA